MAFSANLFEPTKISGLQLWLDASDQGTLYQDSAGATPALANGDPIGMWKDKSGNARHATQTDGTSKPTVSTNSKNLKNCLQFDAVNDWLGYLSGSSATFQHFFQFTISMFQLITIHCGELPMNFV